MEIKSSVDFGCASKQTRLGVALGEYVDVGEVACFGSVEQGDDFAAGLIAQDLDNLVNLTNTPQSSIDELARRIDQMYPGAR